MTEFKLGDIVKIGDPTEESWFGWGRRAIVLADLGDELWVGVHFGQSSPAGGDWPIRGDVPKSRCEKIG